MDETESKNKRDIKLTKREYADLKKALQWPEDKDDVTNLSELGCYFD